MLIHKLMHHTSQYWYQARFIFNQPCASQFYCCTLIHKERLIHKAHSDDLIKIACEFWNFIWIQTIFPKNGIQKEFRNVAINPNSQRICHFCVKLHFQTKMTSSNKIDKGFFWLNFQQLFCCWIQQTFYWCQIVWIQQSSPPRGEYSGTFWSSKFYPVFLSNATSVIVKCMLCCKILTWMTNTYLCLWLNSPKLFSLISGVLCY